MFLSVPLLSLLFIAGLLGVESKSYVANADEGRAFTYPVDMNNTSQIISSGVQTYVADIPDELIVNPGLYNFSGSVYDLDKDGLYDIQSPDLDEERRIVYDGNMDSLLSSMALIDSHGDSDDKMNFTELNKIALHSDIYTTCGTVSKWAHMTLSKLGIPSRLVVGITLDPLNGKDDGHTMIEIYRPDYQKWVVYDIDNNVYFTLDGKPLSFYEFANHVQKEDYDIKYLTVYNTNLVPVDQYNKTSNTYFVGEESTDNNEQSLKDWYKRVIGVPLIDNGAYFYYSDARNMTRVTQEQSNSYYLGKDSFIENFYGATVDDSQFFVTLS